MDEISRIISGKIGLSAKIDYFSGDFIGDKLSEEIQGKIKELELRFPKPLKKSDNIHKNRQKNKKNKKNKKTKGNRKRANKNEFNRN